MTARLQLSAHRYLTRRMERALVHGDVGSEADSTRAQTVSLMTGVALTAVGVIGCLAVPMIRPPADLGDATIVMSRRTGALYVRIDDTVHPVLNLTSARLIAQHAGDPRQVDDQALAGAKHGALLGIPGAPGSIGAPLPPAEATWTVCDGPPTTVIAGPVDNTSLPADEPVLVSGPTGTVYLLFDGRRAALDPADPAVARALRLDGIAPRTVSAALLNTVPEVAPIIAPSIPGAGSRGPDALPGFVVGDVVRVDRAGGSEYYAVLAGGVQRIGAVAADLIRFSVGAAADIPAVAAAALRGIPAVGVLPVDAFPDLLGAPRHQGDEMLCATWAAGAVTLSTATALPADRQPVTLAQADGDGPALDAVFVPPGRSVYVRPDGVGLPTGSVIADTGVRFPVADAESARVLGLADPTVAPWALISAVPTGPALGRQAALSAYDVVGGAGPP